MDIFHSVPLFVLSHTLLSRARKYSLALPLFRSLSLSFFFFFYCNLFSLHHFLRDRIAHKVTHSFLTHRSDAAISHNAQRHLLPSNIFLYFFFLFFSSRTSREASVFSSYMFFFFFFFVTRTFSVIRFSWGEHGESVGHEIWNTGDGVGEEDGGSRLRELIF